MTARFERFKSFGAISSGTLTHVSLMADSDVNGVGPDTPITGLYVVNASPTAKLTCYALGTTFIVNPASVAPIEFGGRIREYTLTPNADVTTGQVQVIHKGPAVA